MEHGAHVERRWIEPRELLRLVARDVSVVGRETAREVIMRKPDLLIPVSRATNPPLDLHTYRVRHDRWRSGDGPRLTGMSEFMRTLETLNKPACAAVVTGAQTSYTLLLDPPWLRVLAAVAIDPPDA